MKQCSKCRKSKDVSEFYAAKDTYDKLYSWCKECKKEYQKKNKRKPETARKYAYKITVEDYEKLKQDADGVCVICDAEFDSDGYNSRPVIDHSHITKKVRGLICHGCNVGLGYFADDPERLETAALYLRAHEATQ